MSTTTAKKPATRKPAAKPAPAKAKATPLRRSRPSPLPKPKAAKPEAKTLIEALTTGQAALIKVRANGTKCSLPYLAVGSEQRKQAEAVAKMREDGQTVEAIAEALKVSTATARRFITNLALAQAVEAGDHDKAWKPGTKEVVVHTVQGEGVRFPTVRIVVERQGKGVTAWAVLVNGEVYVTGLTQRQANKQRAWLEFCARPRSATLHGNASSALPTTKPHHSERGWPRAGPS